MFGDKCYRCNEGPLYFQDSLHKHAFFQSVLWSVCSSILPTCKALIHFTRTQIVRKHIIAQKSSVARYYIYT